MLIERLAAAGDRAGALVAGRELAERLRAELGVGPAPATRAAIARLRGPAAGPPLPPGAGPPMFGRAAELATLSAAWSAARTGRGQVVLVTGEAGIGKTRLVGELARRADNAGARVAVGAGVDVGGEAPLQLWEELARALATVVPRPPEPLGWPAELGRLAPDLARALGRQARRRWSPRRSWSGCGSSTPCCGSSSGRRRAGRCSSWPRTCTGPTARASPSPRTSVDGSPRCPCCSC